jgi:hypothetical protein
MKGLSRTIGVPTGQSAWFRPLEARSEMILTAGGGKFTAWVKNLSINDMSPKFGVEQKRSPDYQ